VLCAATIALSSPALVRAQGESSSARNRHEQAPKPLTKEERQRFLLRAQVWTPVDVSKQDMTRGPQGPGAFKPNESITCEYDEVKLSGASPKFECVTEAGDRLKVRYGGTNGEVQGAVLGSRLLWALGFSADRVYPVRVTCDGCPADPQTNPKKVKDRREFDLAVVERKPDGYEMKLGKDTAGWGWNELALVNEASGGASRAHIEALTLLAIFIQHSDSKPEQQRMVCLPNAVDANGLCTKPFLSVHDVGLTFGHANLSNEQARTSVNFEEWAKTPVWRDVDKCIGHMSQSFSGTLADPAIHEAGRAFLADLLTQVTDNQLRELFEVARVERRSRRPDDPKVTVSADVDEWIAAFKQKRNQIVTVQCPQ
jgi:hypothetical protein